MKQNDKIGQLLNKQGELNQTNESNKDIGSSESANTQVPRSASSWTLGNEEPRVDAASCADETAEPQGSDAEEQQADHEADREDAREQLAEEQENKLREFREERQGNMPRIYVASLADYNAGELHGRWIDANQSAEAIHAEVAAMLKESKEPFAEEWAIHDYEGFGKLGLSEWESFETVAEVAGLIEEHGEVFAALMDYFGGTSGLEEAKRTFAEGYHGEYDSLEDYASLLVEETCDLKALPEFVRGHIDYDGIAHDLEISGDVFTIEVDYQVHVFSNV